MTVPARVAGYFHLTALLAPLRKVMARRITALKAPAGFGKTSAMAETCHSLKDDGVTVAWLTVDGDDTPDVLCAYLFYAFERAGLDLSGPGGRTADSASTVAYRVGLISRAIETHAAPCLLVLDELERLAEDAVTTVELLVRHGPRNLHFLIAFRANPGLDLASAVLGGAGEVLTVDRFRFSKAEIARFFDGTLSRRELATLADRTEGWPVALQICRNTRTRKPAAALEASSGMTANFLGVRLFRDLSAEDHDCLLALAVFDWIDLDLVTEVLDAADVQRVLALPVLDGLVGSIDKDGTVRRLHPIVKDYCLDQLCRRDPARRHRLHREIAVAMARRHQLLEAVRHASEARDERLVGELLERAGGMGLWLRDGNTRLSSIDRLLTPEVLRMYPRLALLHCLVLFLGGKRDEAHALYLAVERETDGFERDREGGDDKALALDRLSAQVGFVTGRCEPLGNELGRSALEALGAKAAADGDPAGLGGLQLMLCMYHYQRGRLDEASRYGLEALAHLERRRLLYACMFTDLHLGMLAMARGRGQEAVDRYTRARRTTRHLSASGAVPSALADVLTLELDVERNRVKAIEQRPVSGAAAVLAMGGWFDIYAATFDVAAELAFEGHGGDAAIRLITEEREQVRLLGLDRLVRYLSALLAAYLSAAGRSAGAEQAWRDSGLPAAADGLLDLDGQTWREMETLCCARIRLLAARGDLGAARDLANRLCSVASERGLTRTRLRGLALAMVVANRSGLPDEAAARLVESLRLVRETGYVKPLVRHREVSLDLLPRVLGKNIDPDVREAAQSMLTYLSGGAAAADAPVLSPREVAVLVELRRGLRNKEIASRLGVTEDGVRYHLKNIYRKLGTRARGDAVRRARSMGILR